MVIFCFPEFGHDKKNSTRLHTFYAFRFACKTFMVSSVPKKKAQKRILETLRNEIDLLRSLDHPNIVRAYESYEVGRDLHLVMELCNGGGERCVYGGPQSQRQQQRQQQQSLWQQQQFEL